MLGKLLSDRRAVTSFEYALLAGAIALVLFEVLQAPADALSGVLSQMFSGPGGHGGG
jgi:Flp pilus assembly pilin Flp